ncbi:hypothetical protein [Micromonospora deserti]|uniref:Uncharacterized protein n=1 Tax=Micromonospora deserti TaxID=2070366 RepID=A0A2W2DJZ6_9ACTN|nr:hypothetical protein [Micromonospora deserti]PZF93153.1 hypothetical protein C1I99_20975 [Micromonospora deserti]
MVDDPDEFRCVAITMGENTVFLPGLWRSLTWDELVQAFSRHRTKDNHLSLNLNGKEVPWPSWPTYLFDK